MSPNMTLRKDLRWSRRIGLRIAYITLATFAAPLFLASASAGAHPGHLIVSDAAAVVLAVLLSAATVLSLFLQRRIRNTTPCESESG